MSDLAKSALIFAEAIQDNIVDIESYETAILLCRELEKAVDQKYLSLDKQ